jgi:8-oxo-dGTP pyrophosphatase MutT (NUDIX family)
VHADRASEPRPAATVILLRDAERLEVLLLQRNPAARFMGGLWVFPGGAVDAGETARVAGVREVAEESGIALPDPSALVEFARWITPPQLRIRFDALFFAVRCPEGAEARPDGSETVDARWYAPADALAAGIELAFPTTRTLEQLAGFDSVDAALRWAADREVRAREPQVVNGGRVVLPDE